MVIKLRNYHKHSFTPLTLLLLSAVIVLAGIAFFPLGIFAQEQKAAEITSPAPESTLDGSTATFAWSEGSQVEDYFLYLGTTPGANDLYGQSQGLTLEVTVSGLPVDGSIIYIRLWSLLPTGWLFTDMSVLAALQESSSGNLVLVKEKLKEMNELLQKAIDDYQNDVIEEDELRDRIDEIVKLKYEVMNEFPYIWGYSLDIWYRQLAGLDTALGYAREISQLWLPSEADIISMLEWAKSWKDTMEQTLEKVSIN